MNKTIETVDFDAPEELIALVDETVEKLAKYHDQIVSTDVYLKKVNTETDTAVVEMRVFLPGKDIYMEQHADNFTSATQQLFDKLKLQLSELNKRDKDSRRVRADKL